jgi:predicted nucleic acid-binding protein
VILLDTSVLIAYLRTGSSNIREILSSIDCAICGVIRAEILHGARTPEDIVELNAAMDSFEQLQILEPIWRRLGNHLATLRAAGLPMPFQDVLITTVAIENNIELWSYDTHFESIAGVIPSLRLFRGPAA